MRRGVAFDLQPDGELALGLEGGHSARRIVHAGGAETGRALTSRLAELAAENERIEVLEGASALALWSDGDRCHGVLTDRGAIPAAATVLATGGGAALWERTTNPRGAIGAGAILAHGAGAELADLELCQFHPTALALPGRPLDGWLITEAVRGEGALLLDAAGRRFTDELAPRDQVTAAILDRMAADGTGAVDLDLRPVPLERFPTITRTLESLGIDAGTGPRAGGPGRALPDRRRPHRPPGTKLAARAARRRRSRMHGAARRQPSRLQLAQRMLRVRQPRRAGRARQPGGGPLPAVPATGPLVSGPDRGEPQRRLGARRPAPRPRAARAAEVRPLSARPPDRRLGAGTRRIPRGPPAQSTTLASTRPWTCSTTSSGPTRRVRLDRWPPEDVRIPLTRA